VRERIAIMQADNVPRPGWKAGLEATRGLEASGRWRDLAGEAELRALRARALGKITSRVSPPPPGDASSQSDPTVIVGILPAGQLAAPWEPAQLDFARTPLAVSPGRASVETVGAEFQASPAQLELLATPQLELPWQRGRRDRSKLRDALRALAVSPRVARCGRTQIAPTVDICDHVVDGRRVAFARGLLTCGSVWSCAVCSAKIRAGRAAEVQRVVAWHGQARTFLWSLTVRHARGHSLARVRRGVALAMRYMQRGAPWRRFKARVGLVGTVRALEVTHGDANGWHPHLHVLLLVEQPAQLSMEREWLAARWASCVVAALGEAHAPNAHGSDLRACSDATYLAKLGLELNDAGATKVGKGKSPWQLAHDVAGGAGAAVDLWREYQAAMFGARMLTWSHGLRRAAGLVDDVTDDELAAEPAPETSASAPVRLSRRLFSALGGAGALLALLEAFEGGGRATLARTAVALVGARRARRASLRPRDGPAIAAA
jgi:hypothetical protein